MRSRITMERDPWTYHWGRFYFGLIKVSSSLMWVASSQKLRSWMEWKDEGDEHQHSVFSASRLWMRCDGLSQTPTTMPSSSRWTVSSDCELNRPPFFQLPLLGYFVLGTGKVIDTALYRQTDSLCGKNPAMHASQVLMMTVSELTLHYPRGFL